MRPLDEDLLKRGWEIASRLVASEAQSLAHREDHLRRVYRNAMQLASAYPDCDRTALGLAAMFHDISQPYDRKREHVELSIEVTRKVLTEDGFAAELVSRILAIMAEHSTEHVATVPPSTIEAKLLFDADKIDGLGATGIARAFALCGQNGLGIGETIAWYRGKIRVALAHMQTPEGREVFESRLKEVERFLRQVESENAP